MDEVNAPVVGGGVTSYIKVYTDVPLEWVNSFSYQIYVWVVNSTSIING
jgi:hypothetical protein